MGHVHLTSWETKMIPFLMKFADKPSDSPEPMKPGDDAQNTGVDVNAFHTRCGHPRRRDD